MSKSLIVNADDFGLAAGVNRGIIASHQHGIVTSATLLVNMPAFTEAAAMARETPRLAVGVHLNLTYGRPLSPMERTGSLTSPDGSFVKDPRFVLKNGRLGEMWDEFRLQVERFLAAGLIPSHLDTHHHLHESGRILDLVAVLALSLGVPVRCLDEHAHEARGLQPVARFTKYFGDRDGVERLLTLIASLPDGVTEIPCHPGYVDKELRSLSTLTDTRESELAALTDPTVRAALDAAGARLTNYRELRG